MLFIKMEPVFHCLQNVLMGCTCICIPILCTQHTPTLPPASSSGEEFARRYYPPARLPDDVERTSTTSGPLPPHMCQYCKVFRSHTETAVEAHWEECRNFPVSCPNSCQSEKMERWKLEEHLEQECPLHLVQCQFAFVGCSVRVQRRDLDEHLSEDKNHLPLLAAHLKQVSKELAEVKQENVVLKRDVASLRRTLDRVEREESEASSTASVSLTTAKDVRCHTGLPPIVFTYPDYFHKKKKNKLWFSPPFYTHVCGYKMCLSVRPYGRGKGNNCISVYTVILRGDYDTTLPWPLQGNIVVELLNQAQNARHYTVTIAYTSATDSACSGPVDLLSLYYPPSAYPMDTAVNVHAKAMTSPWGIANFISHEQLETASVDLRYIHNGCLQFRVASVTLNT